MWLKEMVPHISSILATPYGNSLKHEEHDTKNWRRYEATGSLILLIESQWIVNLGHG